MVIKHAMGHFLEPVDNEVSCTALPDAIEVIEKMV